MKILLVDDEEKFVTMLAKRMRLRGFEIEVATNGDTALELEERRCHDVAVLDIKMPGLSGHDLRDRLSELNKNLKFIFVTGHGAIDRDESKGGPKDAYLSKPLDIEVLTDTIRKLDAPD